MIRGGLLSGEDRTRLIALARDGSAAARVTRRANALVLLDDSWSSHGRSSVGSVKKAQEVITYHGGLVEIDHSGD
jgi:hypothetical protein